MAAPRPPVLLHGDLHHDNIGRAGRGWLAFDPKGVVGEAGYEFANAFRNPRQGGAAVSDPERLSALAVLAAPVAGAPPARLLAWAEVKAALSLIWSWAWSPHAAAPMLETIARLAAAADREGFTS